MTVPVLLLKEISNREEDKNDFKILEYLRERITVW